MPMILTKISDSKITDIQPMLKIADCLAKKEKVKSRHIDREIDRQKDRQIDR